MKKPILEVVRAPHNWKAHKILYIIILAIIALAGTSEALSQPTLPLRIRNYLNSNYSGWKLSSAAPNCDKDFKRSMVIGDFDGDGKRDYTVKLMSMGKGYIVAFLSRGTDFQAHELESGSAVEMRNQGLTIARKGEKYSEIVNENFDRVTRRLNHDEPVGGTCESSAYLYIYRNGSFKRAFVSD